MSKVASASSSKSTTNLRSPGKKASPSKKLSNGYTASEAASIRANYELETRSRRAELESHMSEALANLRSKYEAELQRVPECIHHVTVREFLTRWKGDLVKAAKDTLQSQLEQEQQQDQAKTQSETAHRSPKKRYVYCSPLGTKRETNPRPLESKRNVGEPQQSVPPSPALPQAKRHAPNGFFSGVNSQAPTTSSNRATRRPRKNEHIQAYSLNGSPLGVSTWPTAASAASASGTRQGQDQGPMSVPSTEFTFRLTMDSFRQSQSSPLSALILFAWS